MGAFLVEGLLGQPTTLNPLLGNVWQNMTALGIASLVASAYNITMPMKIFYMLSIGSWLLAVLMYYLFRQNFFIVASTIAIGIIPPLFYAGYKVLNSWKTIGVESKVFGVVIIAYALHQCDYTFLRDHPNINYSIIGFSVALLLVFLLSVLIPTIVHGSLVLRTRELSVARDEALATAKVKSEFLANMSHEIRTPMNVVLGYAQLLNKDPNLTVPQKKSLTAIQNSGHHLLGLINNILDVSRIEAGKVELDVEDFDIFSLTKDMDSMFSMRCQQLNIKWKLSCNIKHAYVCGDLSKLRQILINLLGNAVKFTEHGEVCLSISQIDNVFIFEVSDTGMGISEEGLICLFQPFNQDTAGKMKGGTGLGLAIANELLKLMGSECFVKSQLGEGSRFYFNLEMKLIDELKNTHVQHEKYLNVMGVLGKAPKILIVDDVEENLNLLTCLLDNIGIKPETAKNGKESIQIVSRCKPDLIFMDIKMPIMDGFEAMQFIRHKLGYIDLPIIAVTASSLHSQREESIKAGFTDFISKPFVFEEILFLLDKLLPITYEYTSPNVDEVRSSENESFPIEKNIPQNIIASILSNADDGATSDIKKIVTTMLQDYPIFSNHVLAYVEDFDFDGLMSMLEELGDAQ